jgi:ribosomal protein S8
MMQILLLLVSQVTDEISYIAGSRLDKKIAKIMNTLGYVISSDTVDSNHVIYAIGVVRVVCQKPLQETISAGPK